MTKLETAVRTLAELSDREQATVLGLNHSSEEVKCRLYSLGLYPGVTVEVLRRAPLGDPLQVRSGATLISIRADEAKLIEVSE